jgi:hypothetical protein
MPRPYAARGRGYEVQSRTSRVQRPNKLAAGMTAAYARRGTPRDSVLALLVHGTYDNLARMTNWNVKRSQRVCPCCKQRVSAVVLSDRGRRKLESMRRRAALYDATGAT